MQFSSVQSLICVWLFAITWAAAHQASLSITNSRSFPSFLLLLLLLLSRFSRVRLCATPQTAAHQAPPSLGFSRQEHRSGLSFPSPMHESEKSKWSRSVVSALPILEDRQREHPSFSLYDTPHKHRTSKGALSVPVSSFFWYFHDWLVLPLWDSSSSQKCLLFRGLRFFQFCRVSSSSEGSNTSQVTPHPRELKSLSLNF